MNPTNLPWKTRRQTKSNPGKKPGRHTTGKDDATSEEIIHDAKSTNTMEEAPVKEASFTKDGTEQVAAEMTGAHSIAADEKEDRPGDEPPAAVENAVTKDDLLPPPPARLSTKRMVPWTKPRRMDEAVADATLSSTRKSKNAYPLWVRLELGGGNSHVSSSRRRQLISADATPIMGLP